MSRSKVRRITLVKADGSGASEVYRGKKKKRKASKHLRPAEKLTRRLINATTDASSLFARRYRKSRGKKRDGWCRDMPYNAMKAQRRFGKRLKLKSICM